ncbi:aldo/keto reductase [Bacteroidota bacterium]
MTTQKKVSRRKFIKTSAFAGAGVAVFPYVSCNRIGVTSPLRRTFGRIGFEVTTLGLGGQASIQWTPEDVDPIPIILKAFKLGINYFDTSNLYGPSQLNYNKAFKELNLIPGISGFDESLRKSIFLTTKTHLRFAKGGEEVEGINNWSNGGEGLKTIDDLKRSMTQIFGDGQENYPKGAYLDMVLIHSVSSKKDIESVYTGYENPDPKDENIGALAALIDYRGGTNYTGLNPKEEKLIKHIGFSGHKSPALMMEMIQRDTKDVLDGMLVAINSNDKLNFNMQHNVILVAAAKNMGIIGMKVFADGAMYSKPAEWSWKPEHVVRSVGSPDLPSRPLIEYALTTPGIATNIIGIGQIDNLDESKCQLVQNMSASQVMPDALTQGDRESVEQMTAMVKNGETNYFQDPKQDLTPVREISIERKIEQGKSIKLISWHSSYAGNYAIKKYELWRDNELINSMDYQPQITTEPFVFKDNDADEGQNIYSIKTIDESGRSVKTEEITG